MAVRLSRESQQKIIELCERYPSRRAVMLPALHLATREFAQLDDEVCQAVADLLQVPLVDVKGVVTFYTMFPTEPLGKYLIQLCINLPCALNRARHLMRFLENKLGISAGETTPDGQFTLRGMECLAACDKAPMLYINETMYTDLTEEKLEQILQNLAE